MRLREAPQMQEVDRAELDADRERLAELPDDAACALPVGRVRGYLNALAVALPPPEERPAPHAEALTTRPPDPAIWAAAGPSPPSRPWTLRRLARLPSRGTVAFIVLGGALLLGVSAWQDDVAKAVGQTAIFALIGARAFGIVLDREVRKRDADEVEDPEAEPGALVAFVLVVVTYVVAAVAVREGATLAGIDASWIGAGLFGLLVTLSLALDYGVVPARRLAP